MVEFVGLFLYVVLDVCSFVFLVVFVVVVVGFFFLWLWTLLICGLFASFNEMGKGIYLLT